MENLRSLCSQTRRNKIRDTRVLNWCGMNSKVSDQYEKSVSKYSGHIMEKEEDRIAKQIHEEGGGVEALGSVLENQQFPNKVSL